MSDQIEEGFNYLAHFSGVTGLDVRQTVGT